MKYEFDNGGFYNELNKQEIIEMQEKIIDEYESVLSFINKVSYECANNELALLRQSSDKYNFGLYDFASSTNDCIADNPKLRRLKEKLKVLRGEQ